MQCSTTIFNSHILGKDCTYVDEQYVAQENIMVNHCSYRLCKLGTLYGMSRYVTKFNQVLQFLIFF